MKPRPARATPTMGAVMAMAMTGLLMLLPEVLSEVMPREAVAEAATADMATWVWVGVVVVVSTVMVVVPSPPVGGMVMVTTALLVMNEVVVLVGVAEVLKRVSKMIPITNCGSFEKAYLVVGVTTTAPPLVEVGRAAVVDVDVVAGVVAAAAALVVDVVAAALPLPLLLPSPLPLLLSLPLFALEPSSPPSAELPVTTVSVPDEPEAATVAVAVAATVAVVSCVAVVTAVSVVAAVVAAAVVAATVMSVEEIAAAAAELVGESTTPGKIPETSEPAPAPRSPRVPATPPRRSRRTYIMRRG